MSKKVTKHFIIPIFIPHQGCPHICTFCKQSTITNISARLPAADSIRSIIELAIGSKCFHPEKPKEVAFYGGTFTCLQTSQMIAMLSAVRPFIEKGIIDSIRISTRPDALDPDRLDILKSFGVSTVELGVQSMNDNVLMLSNRGHTSSDTITAAKMLKKNGFNLGVQLMPGLPGDSRERFMDTITQVIDLQPDMARLYPTLVIRGTKLAQWFKQGKYEPMTCDDAVNLCADACSELENAGIPVIRIGLMSSPSLLNRGEIIAGPWHPSFGFLVRSAIHLVRIKPYLPKLEPPKAIVLRAPQEEIDLIRGYKKSGIGHIETFTGAVVRDIIPDHSLSSGEVAFDIL